MAGHLDGLGKGDSSRAREYRALASRLRNLAILLVEQLNELAARLVEPNQAEQEDDHREEEEQRQQLQQQQLQQLQQQQQGAGHWAGGSGSGVGGGMAVFAPAATLSDVLAPTGWPCSINDCSPVQVAFTNKNMEFICASVAQTYLLYRWKGSEYTANALQRPPLAASDDHEGARTTRPDHRPTTAATATATAAATKGSGGGGSGGGSGITSLRRSRGAAAAAAAAPTGFRYDDDLLTMRVLEAAGFSGPAGRLPEFWGLYNGRLVDYFADGVNVVEVMALGLVFASVVFTTVMRHVLSGSLLTTTTTPTTSGSSGSRLLSSLASVQVLLSNTGPILMWVRLLQFLVPFAPSIAVLMQVVAKLLPEVAKFLIPGAVLTVGVAFTLYITFKDRGMPSLSTLGGILLLLFRTFLGETMFEVLQGEKDNLYNMFGNVVVVLYTMMATVVVSNLLISFISANYQPVKSAIAARFQLFGMLVRYEFMVDNHLLGSPFTLPLMAAQQLLPSGWRPMMGPGPEGAVTAGVMPLDGNPKPGESRAAKLYPTGSNELPYLVFLIVMYPFIFAASSWRRTACRTLRFTATGNFFCLADRSKDRDDNHHQDDGDDGDSGSDSGSDGSDCESDDCGSDDGSECEGERGAAERAVAAAAAVAATGAASAAALPPNSPGSSSGRMQFGGGGGGGGRLGGKVAPLGATVTAIADGTVTNVLYDRPSAATDAGGGGDGGGVNAVVRRLERRLRMVDLTADGSAMGRAYGDNADGGGWGADDGGGGGGGGSFRRMRSERLVFAAAGVSKSYPARRLQAVAKALRWGLSLLLLRPLLLLLGLVLYIVLLVVLVLGLWLGVYQWLVRLGVSIYFVLYGWTIGCGQAHVPDHVARRLAAARNGGALPPQQAHPHRGSFQSSFLGSALLGGGSSILTVADSFFTRSFGFARGSFVRGGVFAAKRS
ncbi:hypothetical protein PLESTF_000467500, partial [Pleodorina starrii]